MQFSKRLVKNYQFVSIYCTAKQNRYYFPDLPNLRNVRTNYLYCYANNILRVDEANRANTSNYSLANLTLVQGNDEFVKQVDLSLLAPHWTTDVQSSIQGGFALSPVQIDFSKSYVEISPAVTPVFPFSFCFGIFYEK